MSQLLLFDKPTARRTEIRPVDPHAQKTDIQRLTGQNAAILERLKQGPATNVELSRIALRFGARIKDCRSAGFEIEYVRGEGGVHQYRLVKEST